MSGCLNPKCPCGPSVIDTSGDEGTDETNPAPWLPGVGIVKLTPHVPGVPPVTAHSYMDDLYAHPAVRKHGQGMTSEDLASFVEVLGSLAQSRVKGIGHEQYSMPDRQKFEDLSPEALAEYALEEYADAVSYAAMGAIKMLALLRGMRG